MQRERIFFPQGVNMYVPGMQYNMSLVDAQPTLFSLGTPAVQSANNIATAVNAQTVLAAVTPLPLGTYTADSPYGRTLRLTPSGNPGNAAAIEVLGTDYLGQPMLERFVGASGATAILYGQKAFYRVLSTRVQTAASNGVTWAIGTGPRLGLPFKGDLAWARENGILINIFKRDVIVTADRSAAEAVAGSSRYFNPPFPGFVKNIFGSAGAGGGGNNPVLTGKLATVAIVGLTATFVDASPGVVVTGTPTTPGYNANNRFVANQSIELAAAAAASATTDTVGFTLTPTHFTFPDLTDPGTALTTDPRGTYEPLDSTFDGIKKYEVALTGDNAVNAAGNGGLMGIRHFTS